MSDIWMPQQPSEEERRIVGAVGPDSSLRERAGAMLLGSYIPNTYVELKALDAEIQRVLSAYGYPRSSRLAASPDKGEPRPARDPESPRVCVLSVDHQGLHRDSIGNEWSWFETTGHVSPARDPESPAP